GRRSPKSNARRASRPATKKKTVISPLLSQCRRSCETPEPPTLIERIVRQTRSYEDESILTQASATTVAASSTAALPVSVRRKLRSGVSRLRAHAVRPEKGAAVGPVVTPLLLVALDNLGRPDVGRIRVQVRVAQRAALAQQVPALVERHLQLLQAMPVGRVRVPGRLALPELVLLRDEILDPGMNAIVLHLDLLRSGAGAVGTPRRLELRAVPA